MNPFLTLSDVQNAYRRYVNTFQRFLNPTIRDWIGQRVETGSILWREPYVQVSRRFERGEHFADLVADPAGAAAS
jgi:hypothetical protein